MCIYFVGSDGKDYLRIWDLGKKAKINLRKRGGVVMSNAHNKGRKRKVKTYLIILLDLHNQPVYSKILSVDENFRNFRELLKTDQIFTERTIFLNERFY